MNPILERSLKIIARLDPALPEAIIKSPKKELEPLLTDERKEEIAKIMDNQIRTFVLFGIDDGATYRFLLPWLKRDPSHRLLFFEVDFGKLHTLLSTELGNEMIEEPKLFIIPSTDHSFPMQKEISALLGKGAEFIFLQFRDKWLNKLYELILQILSYAGEPSLFYYRQCQENFYRKIAPLLAALDMREFVNLLKEIPAVIVGAGPSLAEEIEKLKRLEDRAIIIGAGTALKALSREKISPHIVVGLDPNPPQKEIFASVDGPAPLLFFTERFYYEPTIGYRAPTIYIRAEAGDQEYSDLLDPLFGRFYPHVIFSASSSLFAAELALILGAPHVLLTGIDLSYGAAKKYSDAISSAHAPTKEEELRQKKLPVDLVVAIDADTRAHMTTLTFLRETSDFSKLSLSFEPQKLFKADKEAYAIPHIPRKSVTQFSEEMCKKQFDLRGLLHAASHFAKKAIGNNREVMTLLIKRKDRVTFLLNQETVFGEDELQTLPQKTTLSHLYNFLLAQQPEKVIDLRIHKEAYSITESELKERVKKEADRKIRKILQDEISLIDEALSSLTKENQIENYAKATTLDSTSGKKRLWMNGKLVQRYEGTEDQLNGFSRFFSEEGHLLADTTYKNGLKEGPAFLYYGNGEPFALLHFRSGKEEGIQRYFYEGGASSAEYRYKAGLLDNESTLFHENGSISHQISYKMGTRHGVERKKSPDGLLLFEAFYENGQPCGTTRVWSSKGDLLKEIIYDNSGKVRSLKEWDASHKLIRETTEGKNISDSFLDETAEILRNLSHNEHS